MSYNSKLPGMLRLGLNEIGTGIDHPLRTHPANRSSRMLAVDKSLQNRKLEALVTVSL